MIGRCWLHKKIEKNIKTSILILFEKLQNTSNYDLVQPLCDTISQITTLTSHRRHSTTPFPHIQSVHHQYCPCPVHTPYVLSMSSQNTISPDHVLLVHHQSSPNPISTPSFLPLFSQNITSTSHVQSAYHFFPGCDESVHHLYCTCEVSTPSLLSTSNQNMAL